MNRSLNRFSSNLGIESRTILTILPLLIIASFFVWLGYIEWPGMHWDASFFSPPIINVANGRGWHYGGYTPFYLLKGGDSYSFHGFLHIIFYGIILRAATWQWLGFWMGVVNAATYIAYFFMYRLVLRRSQINNLILPFLLALVPSVLAIGLQGRPEHLLLLLFFVPAMLWALSLSGLRWLLPSAVAAGLAPLASPLPGCIFALAVFLFYAYFERKRPRRVFSHLLLALIIGFLTAFFITKVFTPLELIPWFKETTSMGGTAFTGYKYLLDINKYKWGYSLTVPLWNLALLFFIFLGFLRLVRDKSYLSIVLCAGLIYVISPKLLDYGYAVFLPLSLLICLDKKSFLMLRLPSWFSYSKMMSLLTAWSCLYLYVLFTYLVLASGIGFKPELASSAREKLEHQLGLAGFNQQTSLVSYTGAKPSFSPVTDGSIHYVLFDSVRSPITKDDNGDLAKKPSDFQLYEKMTGKSFDFYLMQQIYPFFRKDLPEYVVLNMRKYELIYNDWTDSYTLLERFLWPKGISQDYRFALYKRVEH